MPEELKAGVFTAVWARVNEAGVANSRLALTPIVNAIEKQAKINVSSGTHKYGTRTPASPGSGPAIISGNLRRSITHDPIRRTITGWETKVGTATGFYPPYGTHRTPANLYGYYLEVTGLRDGSHYPFLKPACEFAARIVAPQVYTAMYASSWTRIL